MGKYAKIALVLLYVAQLAILFREQLFHLYKNAVEAVHREASIARQKDDAAEGPRVSVFLKRASTPRFDPRAAFYASSHLPTLAAAAIIDGHHADSKHPHHNPGEDDKHKDRPKKRRERFPLREIVYRNLFPSMRTFVAHPASEAPRERAVLCAVLLPEGFIA